MSEKGQGSSPDGMPAAGGTLPLRVLAAIIVPPHLKVSGGARAGEDLSSALSAHCDIAIASMMSSERPPDERGAPRRLSVETRLPAGLPWRRLPRHAASLFYRSSIPRLVRCGGWDLVHIHNPMPAFELARVAAACRSARVPYVISTHGFNEVLNGERIYGFGPARRLAWRACVVRPVSHAVRRAAGIFALSPADVPIVRAMGYDGVVTQVPNGVPRLPARDEERDARLCTELGISPAGERGQITCMFLANHTPNKGLPVLLEAFRRLSMPCLLIVGGEKRDAVDYAMSNSPPGSRMIITGRLSDEAVGALLRRSDLFVFPTLADTFPLVILEAMSQGCPIVASDIGGISFQVGTQAGLLVPPGDPAALAQAIDSLARQPSRLRFMARCARYRAETHFSWERAAEQAFEGYRLALSRRNEATAAPRLVPRRAPSFPR